MPEVCKKPAELLFPVCQASTQAQLESPVAQFWIQELREPPNRLHRKYWEYAWLLQVLATRGMIAPGRKGLGFAVGTEPISAYLASRGVGVLATDAPPGVGDGQWLASGQYAQSREDINVRWLCPPDKFKENVRFRYEDMNALSSDLYGYDFCWSLCAIEHLGSVQRLGAFVLRSLETLKPGGVAVHSGELFCGDGTQVPPVAGDTVIPRQSDYIELADMLESKGYRVEPLNFDLGNGPVDSIIDEAPYSLERHIKLNFRGVTTTSFGLIVGKPHD